MCPPHKTKAFSTPSFANAFPTRAPPSIIAILQILLFNS
jgi:hypothetical protein